jgi:hypothetical protein
MLNDDLAGMELNSQREYGYNAGSDIIEGVEFA